MLHGTTYDNDFSRNNVGNTLRVFDLVSKTRNVLPSKKLCEKVFPVTIKLLGVRFFRKKSLLQVLPCNTDIFLETMQ